MSVFLRIFRRIVMYWCRSKFCDCGENVVFDPLNSTFSYHNIEIGNNVFIGGRAWFSSSHSQIKIGDNVMFGPMVSVFGGNHIFDVVGAPMNTIRKGIDVVDENVVIDDEAWIGGGVIILTGVTVGRGAIVGAGSVVTKSVEPYAICVGNPAKKVAMRFTPEEIVEHEKAIY